ncbi:MAG: RecX family transcriptional regulator, partial [Acholeplasmatales bacterium]|nr:RecX family transcriptional regulator [Acholeplasmatales bacterium]
MILKEIKKEKKYYTLIFDDGTCFNCLEELIVSNLLLIGKKISEEELEDLKNQNEYFKYYDLALGYISKNMCSKNKLNNYLLRKEANNMIIEKIINTLKNKKLLDDQKYFNYMTDYYFRHHYGKFYIISKGKQENISDEIINNSLENISYEEFYN